MKFRDRETGEICDLEIKASGGGYDVIRREITFERHYNSREELYQDFEDIYE